MYNYKSVFVQPISEPIVVSFNKGINENYRFGYTINQEDSGYDRSIVVLENNIYWKSNLSREISMVKKENSTLLYNCGDKIFNEYLYIMPNPQKQSVDLAASNYNKDILGYKTTYKLFDNIDLEQTDTHHTAYVTYINSEIDSSMESTTFEDDIPLIFNHQDKYYIKKDFNVNPVVLESNYQFVQKYVLDNEDCILSISDSDDDLTLLATDYEIEVNPKNEQVSSIVALELTLPINIYYDKIKTDNVRFVISDNGRLISFSQFTEDYYNDSLMMVFSDTKYKDVENVSIRVGFDEYNKTTDVTANF